MRFLKFLASALLTGGLIYLLANPIALTKITLPAFGNLFNPFSGFWQNGDAALQEVANITSLQGKVKVVYDDRQVPHIFAENTADALRVQGYLHAQNRLFQMDISARSVAGRIAEIAGLGLDSAAFKADLISRRHGLPRAAEASVEAWKKDPAMYQLIEAYCEGVNAYISSLTEKTLPVEYKIMGFQPENWTPYHTALFFKGMCRTLARGEFDPELNNTFAKLGEKDFLNLFPERHPEQKPIVPVGTNWKFKATSGDGIGTNLVPATGFFQKMEDQTTAEGIGSNNWVISKDKSASGKPILSGDPHLLLTLPSVWYECQMTTPELNTYGVSFPGIPFIIIGFNGDVAWSPTNSQHDVANWYRIEWKDASKKQYKLDGQYANTEEHIEEIKVKGLEAPVKEIVRYTKFGPVPFEDGTNIRNDLAFHWLAAIGNTGDLKAFYNMAKAKNFNDFSNALKNYAYPMQNFSFACKDGDIAIRTQGWLPVKPRGAGRLVLDGTTSANIYDKVAPFEHMPFVLNPARGFVYSANQNTTDSEYPYYYNSNLFDNFRARQIHKILSEDGKKFSIDDIRKMQYDIHGLEAEDCLPVMLSHIDSTALAPAEKVVFETLKTWDYTYTKDSKAAMYFSAWKEVFHKVTWDELYVKEKGNPYALPKFWRTIYLVKQDSDNKYFDNTATPQVIEQAKDILASSLKEAVEKVAKEMALQLDPLLDYGKYKGTKLEHIAKIPGFHQKVYTGGDENAINATKNNQGPSWRMIVELGDTTKAFVSYPGGQSGNPGSKHYTDFVERWENGNHFEAIFMKTADEKHERLGKIIEFSAQKK